MVKVFLFDRWWNVQCGSSKEGREILVKIQVHSTYSTGWLTAALVAADIFANDPKHMT